MPKHFSSKTPVAETAHLKHRPDLVREARSMLADDTGKREAFVARLANDASVTSVHLNDILHALFVSATSPALPKAELLRRVKEALKADYMTDNRPMSETFPSLAERSIARWVAELDKTIGSADDFLQSILVASGDKTLSHKDWVTIAQRVKFLDQKVVAASLPTKGAILSIMSDTWKKIYTFGTVDHIRRVEADQGHVFTRHKSHSTATISLMGHGLARKRNSR